MILIKVWYRFTGLMLKWLYRIVFHGDFVYGKRFHMRRAFQLTIENGGRVVLGDDVFFNDFCDCMRARASLSVTVRFSARTCASTIITTDLPIRRRDQRPRIQRGCGLYRETLLDWLQCDDS